MLKTLGLGRGFLFLGRVPGFRR